jgi:GNAT superfamily N-acetyltransferase
VIIIEAKEVDLPILIKLYEQLVYPPKRFGAEDVQFCERIFSRTKDNRNYQIYLAVVNGQVVGTFSLLIMDSVAYGNPSAILDDMVVDENWRGKGIGKMMIAEVQQICREKGCRKLMLSSNINRQEAHHFYKALGFQVHGYSFYVDLEA